MLFSDEEMSCVRKVSGVSLMIPVHCWAIDINDITINAKIKMFLFIINGD